MDDEDSANEDRMQDRDRSGGLGAVVWMPIERIANKSLNLTPRRPKASVVPASTQVIAAIVRTARKLDGKFVKESNPQNTAVAKVGRIAWGNGFEALRRIVTLPGLLFLWY